MSENERTAAARNAVDALRDAAHEGRVIEFRQRDPLVLAIHAALDDGGCRPAGDRIPAGRT